MVGSASGVVATLQQIGGALGIAVVGIIFYGAVGAGAPDRYPHALALGLAFLLGLEAVLAALTTVIGARGMRDRATAGTASPERG
jgi:hypothetical protein